MKPDARKDNGGARPGAGRKPVPTRKRTYRLTDEQDAALMALDGSAWLQGAMNLQLAERPDALVLLQLDALEKKHGREWLAGLAGKINERVARDEKNHLLP